METEDVRKGVLVGQNYGMGGGKKNWVTNVFRKRFGQIYCQRLNDVVLLTSCFLNYGLQVQ